METVMQEKSQESIKQRGRPRKTDFISTEENTVLKKEDEIIQEDFPKDYREDDISIDCLPIEDAPQDGTNVKISEDGKNFIMAYWRRTRCFERGTHMWKPSGRWSDPLTHMDLKLVPKFWKNK
jgi:hypothetical protein